MAAVPTLAAPSTLATVTTIEWLLLVSGLHLGFQATVSLVVYPALAEVGDERWAAAHAGHSRRISLVVGPLYLAVAAVCATVLLAGPRTPETLLAVLGHAVAAAATATVAAPTHGRLGIDGPTPALLRRLNRADYVRTAGAAVAVVGAALAVAGG